MQLIIVYDDGMVLLSSIPLKFKFKSCKYSNPQVLPWYKYLFRKISENNLKKYQRNQSSIKFNKRKNLVSKGLAIKPVRKKFKIPLVIVKLNYTTLRSQRILLEFIGFFISHFLISPMEISYVSSKDLHAAFLLNFSPCFLSFRSCLHQLQLIYIIRFFLDSLCSVSFIIVLKPWLFPFVNDLFLPFNLHLIWGINIVKII